MKILESTLAPSEDVYTFVGGGVGIITLEKQNIRQIISTYVIFCHLRRKGRSQNLREIQGETIK